MAELTRRNLANSLANCLLANSLLARGSIASGMLGLGADSIFAQTAPSAQPPRFGYDDVVRRARELAAVPFDIAPPPLPESLKKFDFDTWRDIRFRPDKAFLNFPGSLFRLELFHLGHLFLRPVTVNTIRDGIPTPIPYTADLFDFGHTKLDTTFPVNLGFAGFRLHFPLNSPTVFDEVIAFLGASYFRFLGRDQRYGLSARGLAVNAGSTAEEFPFFREFWIETPLPNAEHATIYGLLDGEAATGAYRFDLYPGVDSVLEVVMTLFRRRTDVKFGLAALSSMFFVGENDHRYNDDFRRELHDSDGLLVNSVTGEWIWRPLRNPPRLEVSDFLDHQVRGFGLLQRDRNFDHYQDLDLAYELRPTCFVEPHGNWGEGQIELVELPTTDEASDNIVASFVPKDAPDAGRSFSYRITSSLSLARLSPNGQVVGTYQTAARALGSPEPLTPGSHRFIIDFAGGDLAFYAQNPQLVEVVASTSQGKILRSWIVFNSHTNGFRATIDLQLDPGQSTDLRAFLRTGTKALTETWTYPWRAE
ncbi:MAG TPA: glucan biosynthesis protein G [Methylovirgula sp.]|nr:glucan biosynthesis protein G [Methylovirgula sp.]